MDIFSFIVLFMIMWAVSAFLNSVKTQHDRKRPPFPSEFPWNRLPENRPPQNRPAENSPFETRPLDNRLPENPREKRMTLGTPTREWEMVEIPSGKVRKSEGWVVKSQRLDGREGSEGIEGSIGLEGSAGLEGISGSEGRFGTEGTLGKEGSFGTEGRDLKAMGPATSEDKTETLKEQFENRPLLPNLSGGNLAEGVIWAEILGKPKARLSGSIYRRR